MKRCCARTCHLHWQGNERVIYASPPRKNRGGGWHEAQRGQCFQVRWLSVIWWRRTSLMGLSDKGWLLIWNPQKSEHYQLYISHCLALILWVISYQTNFSLTFLPIGQPFCKRTLLCSFPFASISVCHLHRQQLASACCSLLMHTDRGCHK